MKYVNQLRLKKPFIALSVLLTMTLAAKVSAQQDNNADWQVSLKSQTLVSIINPVLREDPVARNNWELFRKDALKMAQEKGYTPRGSLVVTETLIGNQNPGTFILITWPDNETDLAFDNSEAFRPYKKLRPIVWEKVNYYKAPAGKAKTLNFKQDKHYTLMFAWLDKECAEDSELCASLTLPGVSGYGGKHIHQMNDPRFVSVTESKGPGKIIWTEWENAEAVRAYHENWRQQQPKLFQNKLLKRLEWYSIKTRGFGSL
jgi:hypothetical protein